MDQVASHFQVSTSVPLVLFVDDAPLIRTIGIMMLNQIGYRFLAVASGAEAVEVARQQAIDLILMDVEMPEMDGFQATALIRRGEPAGRRVPIIAMTGRDADEVRERIQDVGLDDVLTKPMQVATLRRALVRWLAGRVPAPACSCAPLVAPGTVFDRQVVEQFERMRPGSAATLLGIYLNDLVAAEEALIQALADNDLESLTRISHKLKGASLTIGAQSLSTALKELEQAGRAGDTFACGLVWLRVQPLLNATPTAVAGYLAGVNHRVAAHSLPSAE